MFKNFNFKLILLFIYIMVTSACSLATLYAPEIPDKLYKPSPVTKTIINGIEIGLPQGWKSVKFKETGDLDPVLKLDHDSLGYMTIFQSPFISDAHYGRIITRKLVYGVTPNATQIGNKIAVKSGAIIEVYKGSMTLGGERLKFISHIAYKISNGLGSGNMYYIYANTSDKDSKKNLFNDFIAIVDSL